MFLVGIEREYQPRTILWINMQISKCASSLMRSSSLIRYLQAHFNPTLHFYTPWKRQKTKSFVMFSRGYRNGTLAWNGLNRIVIFSLANIYLLKVNNKNTRTRSVTLFIVSMVHFEQVNVSSELNHLVWIFVDLNRYVPFQFIFVKANFDNPSWNQLWQKGLRCQSLINSY